jgi:hypothetical protein
LFELPSLVSDCVKVGLPHCMLQGLGFQRPAVDYGFALAVLVDALLDGLVGFCRMSEFNRTAFARLREIPIDFDTIDRLGRGIATPC